MGFKLPAVAAHRVAPRKLRMRGRSMGISLRNGGRMSVRDKGPLWIVYPFDSSEEYQAELIYSRSIWQLVRIEVLP